MIDLIEFVIEKLSEIPGVTVRGSYDTAKPKYDMITVMQMDNHELTKYTTIDNIERASAIPIQLDHYSRGGVFDGVKISAGDRAGYLRQLSDVIMQNECGMRRTSAPPVIPHTTDNTVMRAISRYDCMIDLEREIIYKK